MGLEGVLLTRLLPPRLPAGCIDRPELVASIRAGLEGRLVAVIAGAGYGKTTLVAQVLRSVEMPSVWCSCDGRIAGTGSLLAHVGAGIGRRFPGFGTGLTLAGGPDDQIAALANEIVETVPDDFVIALDDIHLLPEDARPAIGLMLDGLGPNVHVVLAGRAPLPLPARMLRLGRAVEIGEAELAFGRDESRRLMDAVGADVTDERLTELVGRTEGWVAGLLLAAQSDGGDDRGAGQADYLADEVILRQTETVRRFLEDTSILGRFAPELAAAVSGRPDAGAILDDLVDRHLFTVRLDAEGAWYRYHHLLRDALRSRLRRAEPARTAALHRGAAEWWLAEGSPTEAVPHLLAAGDVEDAVDALEPIAETLALGPDSAALSAWLDTLPPDLWETRPGMLLAHASLLLTRAEHEASFAEHERAIGRLLEMGDDERAAAALFRLQVAMLLAGTRPSLRAEVGRRWRDRIAPDASLLPAARLLLASAYGYDCRFAEAREEIAAALALPAAGRTPGLRDFADVVRGFYVDFWQDRPREAVERVGAALARLRALGDDPLSLLPFATMLHSYLTLEMGDYRATLDAVEAFFAQTRRIGVHQSGNRSAAWVRATCQVGLGRWDELERDLEPAPAASDTSYSYRYRAPAARLAGIRRRTEEVRSQIRAGRAEMEAFGRVFDDATFLADFALAAAEVGDESAAACADEAVAAAGRVGSPWLRARAALVAAICAPDADARDTSLTTALEVTERWGLTELWTRRERLNCPPLLARALIGGLGPHGTAERLVAGGGGAMLADVLEAVPSEESPVRARIAELAGESADVDLAMVDRLLRDRDSGVREAARRSWARMKARPRSAIAIRALGELQVSRDGVPVPASAFVRQKARALLARLVVAPGPVHREMLSEELWPELPAERAAGALRTTLHDLRRAVEPELEAGSADSLIVAGADTIRLSLAAGDRLDVAEFRAALAEGAAAGDTAGRVDALRRAVSLYRAPLLEEWPYDDWAIRPREELELAFESGLEGLAAALLDGGHAAQAVAEARRLVRRQPERESWHRLLMRAYEEAGDRAMALRQFHACRAVLRREQGIEPGPQSRALYERLLLMDAGAPAPGGAEL